MLQTLATASVVTSATVNQTESPRKHPISVVKCAFVGRIRRTSHPGKGGSSNPVDFSSRGRGARQWSTVSGCECGDASEGYLMTGIAFIIPAHSLNGHGLRLYFSL